MSRSHEHENAHHAQEHGNGRVGKIPTQAEVEERYSGVEQLWSGNPNNTLVEFASTVQPGRALDIGCGEGADVVWLAQQGWDVDGIDLSPTAIARSRAALEAAGVAGNVEVADCTVVEAQPYDLVSVHYGQLPRTTEMLQRLESWVAPGGHLLFVHHVMEHEKDIEIILPDWLEEHSTLEVVAARKQSRNVTTGSGAHHHEDVLLILRRN